MRLIDADALIERMYHDAFETDTDMQKWDSGCWIRYKMFENAMDDAPTIDAVSVVRCKECKYEPICNHSVQHTTHEPTSVTIGYKSVDFCSYGERRE